ncbi:hypothetical protein TM48_02981 [Mycobacterium shottsii]|nr:hypothetical protein TM48_02981 [Mycobacterium shottsii]
MKLELVEPQMKEGYGASVYVPTVYVPTVYVPTVYLPTEPRARLKSRSNTFATAGGTER